MKVHSDALLRHDGLYVLSYDTKGCTDFSGFDCLLDRLYHATNPASSSKRAIRTHAANPSRVHGCVTHSIA